MLDFLTTSTQTQLAALCQQWQIVELAVFGSALRADFRPDSDIDVLINFHPGARHTLFDLVTLQAALEQLFERKVDLLERSAVEQSRNPIRRQAILQSAQVIYAA